MSERTDAHAADPHRPHQSPGDADRYGDEATPTRMSIMRRNAGSFLVDNFFRGLSRIGRYHPQARGSRHGVEIIENVPYVDGGLPEQRLDVYRPTNRSGPLPVVLYIHGGGFRILSKDTHWLLALAYARRGYLVFNISYRLAPQHPFPAALDDTCAAYRWLLANAASYGGDLSRLIFAGESAGANLATSLALATCYRRPEPYARAVFEAGVVPVAVVAACGILQVSDADRFSRRKRLPTWVKDRLTEVSEAYLRGHLRADTSAYEFADPLLLLERGLPPDRPLPAFFAPVGTADPILDDTRRLKTALDRLGVPCQTTYYNGEPHAFHAMIFRENARRCWRDTYAFLDQVLEHAADGARPEATRRSAP